MIEWDGESDLAAGMIIGYSGRRSFLIGKNSIGVWVVETQEGININVPDDKIFIPPSPSDIEIAYMVEQILTVDPSISEESAKASAKAIYATKNS